MSWRRDRRSAESLAYRKLYKTKRWLEIRQAQLTAEPLCQRHKKRGQLVRAEVVHHVKAHKGDEYLFYHGEVESLCKACHDSDAQSEEARGYSKRIGSDGWPVDPKHPANQ